MIKKVEEFNIFFVNVGKITYERSQSSLNIDHQYNDERANTNLTGDDLFRLKPIDTNTLILTIKHLKDTNSCGSDGIILSFIKDALCVTAYYLTCIINTSIVTGNFPRLWKHATITPIFKSGDQNSVNDYRPISLLQILSKILEKKLLINTLHRN